VIILSRDEAKNKLFNKQMTLWLIKCICICSSYFRSAEQAGSAVTSLTYYGGSAA